MNSTSPALRSRRRRRSRRRDTPGSRWQGQVEEIPHAVVDRQTRPEDPGRPADTRVLRVKVAFREPNPLKLGQHVEVEIIRGKSAEER